MIQDCMYSTDESDISDVDSEEQEIIEFGRLQRENRNIMNKECSFFQRVMAHPFLWRFKDSQSYDASTWLQPVFKQQAIDHFYDQLDEETIRSIQLGINLQPNYSLYSQEKKHHFSRRELKIIFKLAAEWMELKRLGANNYTNELCWVASKIMFVQIG